MTETLGPYELVRLIGKGGMGEVHLARDPRLDRQVALKLLPTELADNVDRRTRFLREARAAATLNHPNITTIYDVGEADGRDYIAQEYLDGRPLNEMLAERSLPLAELADIAVPLAEAMAYAHGRGVIHRDLKPANVIVTSRGHAKLLDFGLAKVLRGADDPEAGPGARSTTLTLSGAIFGTPSAMSPEQALGKPVDARGDVFSFGALLYEMATGKPAFLGTTIQETMNKVLNSEPEPLARLRRDLPNDFAVIVSKALRKDPAERYQSMADLVADLRHFKRTTDSGVVPPATAGAVGGTRVRRAMRMLPVLLILLLIAAAALLLRNDPGADLGDGVRSGLPRFTNPRQITSAVGWEDSASWSGSGELLAYHAKSGTGSTGKLDIWITQVGSGTPVSRTTDFEGDAIHPSVSPDGRTIAFWGLADPAIAEPFGLYTVPVIGGALRVLLPGALQAGPPQWSADGNQIAFLDWAEPDTWSIQIVDRSGTLVRAIDLPDEDVQMRADLAWSRDGKLYAYVVTPNPENSDTARLWMLREADGAVFPLTDGRTLVVSPGFSADGRALHYVSNQGGAMDLWRQALDSDGAPTGEPVALTAGLGMGRAAFSGDGRHLAYSRGGEVSNIWRVPYREDGLVTWSDARQVTFDEASIEFASLSPDGTQLAVTSNRAGNKDIWVLPSEGGQMKQLTTDPTPDWAAEWSPDGEQMLFYAFRSGNRDLWVMPSRGGKARQLTTDPVTDWFGSFSPDGTRIRWLRQGAGLAELWISSLSDWSPRRVEFDDPLVYVTTNTGHWIDDHSFWVHEDDGDFAIFGEDGALIRSYPGSDGSSSPRVLPGARRAITVRQGQILGFDLDTGAFRTLSNLTGRPGKLGPALITDGNQIWFTWVEERGDLWVMDVAGDEQEAAR